MPAASRPSSSRVSKAEYETLAALRYHIRRFLRFSERAARTAGLTPRHHQALLAIKGAPKREHLTIGELAEQLQIAHHSAVELVDRLTVQNLVNWEFDLEDRRRVYVKLSPKGSELLQELSATHRVEIIRMGPILRGLLEVLNLDRE